MCTKNHDSKLNSVNPYNQFYNGDLSMCVRIDSNYSEQLVLTMRRRL